MKKSLKRRWPYLAFALGLLLIMMFSTFAPSYEDCSANYQKQYSDPEKAKPAPEVHRTFSENAMVFAECEGEVIHANEGVILAVSTIFLALFTLALWRSTDNLWEAGERQIDIARDNAAAATQAANATMAANRAFVHVAQQLYGSTQGGLWFGPLWGNSGNTPTKNMRTSVHVELSANDLPANYDFDTMSGAAVVTAFLGPRTTVMGARLPSGGVSMADLQAVQSGAKRLFLMGWAKYFEVFPNSPERITRFCYEIHLVGNLSSPAQLTVQFGLYPRNNCADEGCP